MRVCYIILLAHEITDTCIFILGTVNCLKFYQDKYMFSASEDGSVCVWNCTTWECVYQLNGHR